MDSLQLAHDRPIARLVLVPMADPWVELCYMPFNTCPSLTEVEHLDGGRDLPEVETHLSTCPYCLDLVINLARTIGQTQAAYGLSLTIGAGGHG